MKIYGYDRMDEMKFGRREVRWVVGSVKGTLTSWIHYGEGYGWHKDGHWITVTLNRSLGPGTSGSDGLVKGTGSRVVVSWISDLYKLLANDRIHREPILFIDHLEELTVNSSIILNMWILFSWHQYTRDGEGFNQIAKKNWFYPKTFRLIKNIIEM